MSKHVKRERRYAARAAEVKQKARGRLTAAKVYELLRVRYGVNAEQARRLFREALEAAESSFQAVPIAPRLSILCIPVWEDVHLGELAMWRGARYIFIDGPTAHRQSAWRKAQRPR
jgi:hypothetical protein